MNRESSKKFFKWGARISVVAAFFSPLIVAGDFYFPYIVPKTVFFQSIVEVALFFFVLLAVLDKKYVPRIDKLSLGLLLFFGAYVLSSVLGANPARSFFGTYERMLGVVNLTHFVALFFITRSVFESGKDWLWLFRLFLGASVLVSLYGLAQKLNFSFAYHAGIDRIDSTIGNPAFVGGYLIFAVFFALILLMGDKNPFARYFYAFSLALNGIIIYFSGTRGAALGLAVGLFVAGIAFLFRGGNIIARIDKKMIAGGLTVVVLAALAAFLLDPAYLKRFTSVSLSDATLQTRIFAVKTGWEGFLARPVLGWGPENYNLVFDKYYNPKIYPMENWFDHAHNIFFDILTTMGAVGFLAYFFFLGVLTVWAFKRVGALALGLVVAYFVQNIFVFDSLVTYLPLVIFTAFVSSGAKFDFVPEKPREKTKIFYNPSLKAAAILLPVFALVFYLVNIRPLLGAYYAVAALQIPPAYSAAAVEYFKKSLDSGYFGKHEIRGRLAEYASEVAKDKEASEEDKKKILEYTIEEMRKNFDEHPLDFRNYFQFSIFLTGNRDALQNLGVDALRLADETLNKAQDLAPRKQALYLQRATVKSLLGDNQEVADAFKKASDLNPAVVDQKLRLATAYLNIGENDKARVIFADIFQAGVDLGVQQYIGLATGFARLGMNDQAIAAARKVAELDPSMKEETDRFIKQLEGR